MNKKSGKGKGKHFEDLQSSKFKTSTAEDNEFPGAIAKGTYFLAKTRDGSEWKLAKVIEIRKVGDFGEEIVKEEAVDLDEKFKGLEVDPKIQYEYYINYIGVQRRNDRWVDDSEMRFD